LLLRSRILRATWTLAPEHADRMREARKSDARNVRRASFALGLCEMTTAAKKMVSTYYGERAR
jgi:hypothetical protein